MWVARILGVAICARRRRPRRASEAAVLILPTAVPGITLPRTNGTTVAIGVAFDPVRNYYYGGEPADELHPGGVRLERRRYAAAADPVDGL